MAMARPPRVIVLIDSPARWNTTAVARIETGIAVSEIAVVRTFKRKANSTTATTTTASISTVSTLRIEVSMKFACRKMSWSARTPLKAHASPTGSATDGPVRSELPLPASGPQAFRLAVISARAVSTSRVSRTVSTAGCFSTETTTAGAPM